MLLRHHFMRGSPELREERHQSAYASPLDADRLSDQDHGHATVYPLPLDEQDLAHK